MLEDNLNSGSSPYVPDFNMWHKKKNPSCLLWPSTYKRIIYEKGQKRVVYWKSIRKLVQGRKQKEIGREHSLTLQYHLCHHFPPLLSHIRIWKSCKSWEKNLSRRKSNDYGYIYSLSSLIPFSPLLILQIWLWVQLWFPYLFLLFSSLTWAKLFC